MKKEWDWSRIEYENKKERLKLIEIDRIVNQWYSRILELRVFPVKVRIDDSDSII